MELNKFECRRNPPIIFLSNRQIWEKVIKCIEKARSEILIVFPWLKYRPFINMLINLKRSKPSIDIRILTGSEIYDINYIDHKRNVLMLDSARINIRTIKEPFPHAKGICIDRRILIVGSMNASFYSIERNIEFAILTTNKESCRRFCEEFESMWNKALFQGAILF